MAKNRQMTKRSKAVPRENNLNWKVIGMIAGGSFILILAIVYVIWLDLQPVPILGELAQISSPEHIIPGGRATNYTTDPPTSGNHDSQPVQAGFYDVAPPDEQMVHNLEHGYVIVYYNCSQMSDEECGQFKEDLQDAMSASGVAGNTRTPKIIVVPRPDMDNLLTYTSWGRIYRVDVFDRDEFVLFVKQNRNQAPEPRAP
jgi:hypothetical protein